MSGARWEPVEVWLNGGRPGRFVWRERLYTVLAIVERPRESGSGESGPGAASARGRRGAGGSGWGRRPANGARRDAAAGPGPAAGPGQDERPGPAAEQDPDEARDRGEARGQDDEQGPGEGGTDTGPAWECWRVTASSGMHMPAASYRLCVDPATGRWLLAKDSG